MRAVQEYQICLSHALLSQSPFCLWLYLCNSLSSPSPVPHQSLEMFPRVSFNEVNLGSWKLPSQGHFIVTLRWTLPSLKGGNIRSLGSHKKPRLSLSLFPVVCRYGLKGYADAQQCRLFLRHTGNNICTRAFLTLAELCDAAGPQSPQL